MAHFGGWSKFGGGTQFGGKDTLAEIYYRALKSLDPPGVFKDDDHTVHDDITRTEAYLLGNCSQAYIDQLEREMFPGTADQTLEDWEDLLNVIPESGATLQDRQADAKSAWQCALGSRSEDIRQIVADLLKPTIYFWDRLDDNDVSFRFSQTAGNGSISETSLLRIECTSGNDCSWDATTQDHPHVTLKNIDRDDTYNIQANIDGIITSADTADCGGIAIMNDVDNAIGVEVCYDGSTYYYVRCWKLFSSVKTTIATSSGLTSLPTNLKIVKTASAYQFYYNETTLLGSANIEDISLIDRYFVMYSKNDSSTNQFWIDFDDFIVKYDSRWNNVELIRTPSNVAGEERDIFHGFIHRDPYDTDNSYRLEKTQRVLDRVKQAHTFIRVGESDCFRCDDEYSLTDRDVLGS